MSEVKLPIYLDYSATTPIDPRVAAKMAECLTIEGNFGNPSVYFDSPDCTGNPYLRSSSIGHVVPSVAATVNGVWVSYAEAAEGFVRLVQSNWNLSLDQCENRSREIFLYPAIHAVQADWQPPYRIVPGD